MKLFPNIEQVGFVFIKNQQINLNMAGGEFCGNATRSTARLALDNEIGDLEINVSGVNKPLKAGITKNNEAYAQMPVFSDPSKVKQDPDNKTAWIVEMEGIIHYIDFDSSQIQSLSKEEIKRFALTKIKEKKLDKFPASGVIFVRKLENENFQIIPIVYVKNIGTLFLETACGSGTCALGQVMAIINNQSIVELPVVQPSGEIIKISIDYQDGEFKYAQIQGQVQNLSQAIIRSDKLNSIYVIEKLTQEAILNPSTKNSLISLYKEVFSQPPYSEFFKDEEVLGYLQDYISKGTFLIARNKEGIIGFAAIIPAKESQDISSEIEKLSIDQGCQYIAELGVKEKFRRRKIGKGLLEELLFSIQDNVQIILRTQENNVGAITLYQNLGFQKIEGAYQTINRLRTDESNIYDNRIFMIKSI